MADTPHRPRPSSMPDEDVERLRQALLPYSERGASWSPASIVFDLVALGATGTTGEGAYVCPDCVRQVAADALAHMAGEPMPAHDTCRALRQCGSAAGYLIIGATDLPYDTFCAECERPIIGSHIPICNGRTYISGPREGRTCFCHDIHRLFHVRPGDGASGELEDLRGDRYLERLAGAELRCRCCDGPIHAGELYCIPVDSIWTECCRCTFVY